MKTIRASTFVMALTSCLILFTTPASADSMHYNGPNGQNMGGVYTSPYSVSVNGNPVFLICDDALTDINPGLDWTANRIALSTAGTAGKFASQTNSQAEYNAVGWLAQQLFATWQTNSFAAGELSFAIWNIFDPGVAGYLAGLSSTEQADVAAYDLDALTNHSSVALGNVYVYVPDPLTASQEFIGIGNVPDGGLTLMLLGGALVGIEALRRRFRV